MKNKATDTEQRLLARLAAYSDLTRYFYYPDEKLLTLLDSGEMESHLPLYRFLGLELSAYLKRIKEWRQGHKDNGAALLELKREYTRLFITAHPKLPAPPYGSLYLEDKGMIWGETTVEAVKLYAEAGLKAAEDFKDVPDHFAAELEFMWYLIREGLKAKGITSDGKTDGVPDKERASMVSSIEKKFLCNHLVKWAPPFLDRVMESTRSAFYREIANLAKEFFDSEIEILDNSSTHA